MRDRHVWLFNSAQFNGNPKWLMLYVTQKHPEIEAYWVADSPQIQRQVEALGFASITLNGRGSAEILRRAGVYVVNQVKEVIPRALQGVTLLNLWHGVGVKGIERGMNEGYLRHRIAKKYIQNNQTYHDTQLFLVSSPLMEQHFTRYIGLDDESTIRGGYPQNIYPKLSPGFSSFPHDVRARKGLPSHTKLALYAPTPRRERSSAFMEDAFPDLPRLNEALRTADTLLILKMHPHLTNDPSFVRFRSIYAGLSHVMFWDNDEDIYEIAHQIDLAIMDYSSILYDLMAAGVRSFVRYIFDFDSGGDAVLEGGDLDYFTLSCGTIVRTFDELCEAVGQDNEVTDDELARLQDVFWAYSTPESLEHIVQRALSFTPRHVPLRTLHSYDVFDTVIHRRGVVPLSAFAYVKQRLQTAPDGLPAHLVANFIEVRRSAERTARQNRRARSALVQSGDLEVTLAEIYSRITAVYSLTDEQTQRLIDLEIEAELASVVPDQGMIDKALAHRSKGDDVVLISDMYLPEETIREMLHTADPRLGDLPLYLSNTWHSQKTTSRLFLDVYDDLPYDHAEWVHTGDSQVADVTRPKALGIRTKKLETPALGKQEQRLVDSCDTYDGYLVAGMLNHLRDRSDISDVEAFAVRHVAFYLVPYINWVLRDAVERGYRKLWFISRDGHHLRRIADEIISMRGLDIQTGYIYGSRKAWRLASMVDDIDDDYFSGHGNIAGASTPSLLLDSAELTRAQFLEFFPEHRELLNTTSISRRDLTELLAAMAASAPYRAHLLTVAAEQRQVMLDYFDQELTGPEPYAFVEYWGRGYTQDCLQRALQTAHDEPLEVPFYYARSIYPSEGGSVRHNFTSSEHSLLFIEALFANLPYGTVTGYRREDGRVVPVSAHRDFDVRLFDALERILPLFARRYAELPVLDADRLDRDVFEFGFEHYSRKPDSAVYVSYLARLKDSVMMGGAEREFAPVIDLRMYVNHLRGRRLKTQTTSIPLSLARSSRLIRALNSLQQKVGFRRVLRKAKAQLDTWRGR